MGKVVVLKLDGDFEQGFRVTLEIGEDGKPRCSPATGKLPPIPEISQLYESWQDAFRSLGSRFRLEWEEEEEADDAVVRFSPGVNSSCKNFNEQLQKSINDWLDSKDFRRIKKELRQLEDLLIKRQGQQKSNIVHASFTIHLDSLYKESQYIRVSRECDRIPSRSQQHLQPLNQRHPHRLS